MSKTLEGTLIVPRRLDPREPCESAVRFAEALNKKFKEHRIYVEKKPVFDRLWLFSTWIRQPPTMYGLVHRPSGALCFPAESWIKGGRYKVQPQRDRSGKYLGRYLLNDEQEFQEAVEEAVPWHEFMLFRDGFYLTSPNS